MVPQGNGIIGEWYHRERADHEWQAKPEQAIRQIVQRSLPGDARPDEQARQEKEHRHEKTVGGEHDHVEAEEFLRVGVTVICIGDDGVVQQHHQRQEGAGAVERRIAHFDPRRCSRLGGRRCIRNRRHERPSVRRQMLQRRLYFSKPELRDSLHYAYMRPKSFDVRKGVKS
jgi:hypothetical protein